VADAVGFRYRWDADLNQFLHPVGVFVLTPDGRVARWISGAGFDGTDLRLALTEAGGGMVGSLTDRLRLLCYHYDPVRGTYDAAVLNSLRVAGMLTVLGVGGGIAWAVLRERRQS
jgi:protein SCO1/2